MATHKFNYSNFIGLSLLLDVAFIIFILLFGKLYAFLLDFFLPSASLFGRGFQNFDFASAQLAVSQYSHFVLYSIIASLIFVLSLLVVNSFIIPFQYGGRLSKKTFFRAFAFMLMNFVLFVIILFFSAASNYPQKVLIFFLLIMLYFIPLIEFFLMRKKAFWHSIGAGLSFGIKKFGSLFIYYVASLIIFVLLLFLSRFLPAMSFSTAIILVLLILFVTLTSYRVLVCSLIVKKKF